MPETLSDEQIKEMLKGATEPQEIYGDPLRTRQIVQEQITERQPAKYDDAFIRYNKALDVPLDIESGANTWQRIKSAFRSKPEEQLKFWQDLYGANNVRPAMFQGKPTGGLIIRTIDEANNKPKDVLVDEESFTLKDLSELSSAIPEVAGAVIGGVVAKSAIPLLGEGAGMGLLRAGRNLIATTIGSETAAALKDITVRAADDLPVGLNDILQERFVAGIPRDLALALGLSVIGKGAQKVITPFGDTPPAVNLQGAQASKELEAKFGEAVPYSTGQKTGSPLFQRAESEMRVMPGGASVGEDIRVSQQNVFERLMNRIRGLPAEATEAHRRSLPSEEEVGRLAITRMQELNEPYEQAIVNARNRLINETQRQIERDISGATLPNRLLYLREIGQAVRTRVTAIRDDFTAQSNKLYDEAKTLPGGQDRILIDPNLPKAAKEYLDTKLPSKETIIETIDYDQFGSPIIRTSKGRELLKEFIPSNVTGKLQELASVGETKFSLQDLIAMRNEVGNDIAQGEAIAGVRTHHLREIRDMLTGAIKNSTDAIPDGQLKKAWEKANDFYAGNVGKFHTKLISSIMKDPDVPGAVGDHQLVKRLISNEDNIIEAKDFLGESSTEYRMLKRGIADQLYSGSLVPGTTRLDADKFLKTLAGVQSDNRELFDEVFGRAGDDLLKASNLMGLGQKARGTRQIESEIIDRMIENPAAVPRLTDLMRSEKAKDAAYLNQVRRWVGSESVPGDLQPGEFINRFLTQATPAEAANTMKLIRDSDPILEQKIKFKFVENLLAQAEREPLPTDTVALRLDPNRVINSGKLEQLLGSSEKQRLYESVLGNETINDLKNLAKAVRPIEQQQQAYSTSGRLSAGMQIGAATRGNVLQIIDKATRVKIISALLTMKPTRAWLENTVATGNEGQRFLLGVISTEPYLESLIDEYGKEGAARMMQHFQFQLNQAQGQPNAPAKAMTDDEIRNLLR